MQTLLYKQFLKTLLLEKRMQRSNISNTIRRCSDYVTLKNAEIISEEKTINGGWVCIVKDETKLFNHYKSKFPVEELTSASAINNAHVYRNSKARKRTSQSIVLLRGRKEIKVNGNLITIDSYTNKFGLFSTVLKELVSDKICFVENLDSFMMAEEIFGWDFTFIHSYGRPGKTFATKLRCNELIVFSDYDYVGLKDYLNIKKGCPAAKLYITENFEYLYDNYHSLQPLKQQQYSEVMMSLLPEVIRVRNKLVEKGRILEQQKLFKLHEATT